MSELTIEQRREEIRRQQDELARAEAEERKRQRDLELQKEQEQRKAAELLKKQQYAGYIASISAAIAIRRPVLAFTLTDQRFDASESVETGEAIAFIEWVDFSQKYDGSGYYSRRPIQGQFDIIIGTYGDKKRFAAHKDGSHSYDKIAAELISRFDTCVARIKRERACAANTEASAPIAEQLRQKFNLHTYGNITVRPSGGSGDNVVVKLPEAVTLSPEKAEQLLIVLQQIGLIK